MNQVLDVEVVRDVFVSGVGQVELLGTNARITWYVEREAMGGGEPDRIAVAKIVVAIADIPNCIKEIVSATWNQLTHVPVLEIAIADRVGRH